LRIFFLYSWVYHVVVTFPGGFFGSIGVRYLPEVNRCDGIWNLGTGRPAWCGDRSTDSLFSWYYWWLWV